MQAYELTIIIPLKIDRIDLLQNIGLFYSNLAINCYQNNLPIQILIANSSSKNIFDELSKQITHPAILHFTAENAYQDGKNDKLNNIHAALAKAKSSNIVLLDDDMRPSINALQTIQEKFQQHDFFRCMVCYENPNIYDLIDLAGIYFINTISKYKQFWGNICFKKALVNENFFPNKNILFDDFGLELFCRQSSKKFSYIITPPLPMLGSLRTLSKFFEQRLRYSYENLAFPIRFIIFLILIPLLGVGLAFNTAITSMIFLTINFLLLGITYCGQQHYEKKSAHTSNWLYIIFWFWSYPFFSWLALIYYFTGGIYFGKNKLKKII